jgi:hypothetical protein
LSFPKTTIGNHELAGYPLDSGLPPAGMATLPFLEKSIQRYQIVAPSTSEKA